MKYLLRVTVNSHYFLIDLVTDQARKVIQQFAIKLVQFTYAREKGKNVLLPTRTYASSTNDREQYRFHINQLNDFMQFLSIHHINEKLIDIVRPMMYVPTTIPIHLKDGWAPRDIQVPAVKYITNGDGRIKFIPLQTGKGKTAVALFSIAELNQRTLIVLKPGYIVKWVEDIQNITMCGLEDIITVQGSDQLRGLLELAHTKELKAKFIIISNKTYQNWIKQYETDRFSLPDLGYHCMPDQLCEYLDVGIKLTDEIHQDFHLNFKIDLYTNVPLSISLSATLTNHDPFMMRMYQIAYPNSIRLDAGVLDKYIDAIAVNYTFNDIDRIRTTDFGNTMYSHHAFEKSILKNFKIKYSYFKMIKNILEEGFISDYKAGEKAIVFCISISMIEELTEYLAEEYPDLKVVKYVAGDNYDDLINADIRVSSIQNAGTAVDMPDLKTTVQTISVNSAQANIQTLGRLRKRDGAVRFYYTYCPKLQKQQLYHIQRKEMLLERCRSFKEIDYHTKLG
jgi:superfamily II DNA or RNA helicase